MIVLGPEIRPRSRITREGTWGYRVLYLTLRGLDLADLLFDQEGPVCMCVHMCARVYVRTRVGGRAQALPAPVHAHPPSPSHCTSVVTVPSQVVAGPHCLLL